MAVKKRVPPKKKAVSRKKTSRRKKQKPVISNELKKILVGIAILVSICLTMAMIADLLFQPGRVDKKRVAQKPPVQTRIKPALDDISDNISEDIGEAKRKKHAAGLKEKPDKPFKYEVFEDVDPIIVEKPLHTVKDKKPKIAIIIDDIGYDKKTALALCDLNPNITFSVLPFAPFGQYISDRLRAKGSELMLHLPMEPVDYPNVNPGPGAILSGMSADVLLDQLRKNIDDVPYIVGVNNHMGSELTTHSDQMNQIFTILKKEKLFFVDSRTAAKSQCKASARLLKLKFAQRDVFLDNLQETDYITGQFKELIKLAKKHGSAIGIGHPYQVTLETLSRELPKLKNTAQIVRVSSLTVIYE